MSDPSRDPILTSDGSMLDSPGLNVEHILGTMLRVGIQLLGVGLVVAGAFYGLNVFFVVLSAIRDPAAIAPGVKNMVDVLGLENFAVPIDGKQVPFGKTLAVWILGGWYFLCVWISLTIISAGSKLIMAPMNQRRETLAAMREFLVVVRQETGRRGPNG